jgi:hypothetical protein
MNAASKKQASTIILNRPFPRLEAGLGRMSNFGNPCWRRELRLLL